MPPSKITYFKNQSKTVKKSQFAELLSHTAAIVGEITLRIAIEHGQVNCFLEIKI